MTPKSQKGKKEKEKKKLINNWLQKGGLLMQQFLIESQKSVSVLVKELVDIIKYAFLPGTMGRYLPGIG